MRKKNEQGDRDDALEITALYINIEKKVGQIFGL